jgi:F0F1-type ATP synthase gamma subunit
MGLQRISSTLSTKKHLTVSGMISLVKVCKHRNREDNGELLTEDICTVLKNVVEMEDIKLISEVFVIIWF